MTEASSDEQRRLGLLALSHENAQRLERLNAAYTGKFGFPFIVAVRRHPDLSSLFAEFESRLERARRDELQENVDQIGEVLKGRLGRLLSP